MGNLLFCPPYSSSSSSSSADERNSSSSSSSSNCCCCHYNRHHRHSGKRRSSIGESVAEDSSLIGGGSDSWMDEIWYDALMEHENNNDDHNNNNDNEEIFHVLPEEVSILKTDLAKKFPNDCHYLSDAYILSVASKPYSKDMSVRRPLEYSMKKLTQVMEWRQQVGAPDLLNMVQLAYDHSKCPPNVSTDVWRNAQALADSLNRGSLYWHGLTKTGRPILWIRTDRKPWRPNVQAELNALIVMADTGITEGMPQNVTDFCCISHSHNPPPPNPQFAYGMLTGLVQGYPDRLQLLISAPVSSIVEFCMNLLLPLMPGRLQHKFTFLSLERLQQHLPELLWHGWDDVPAFFGGPNTEHDLYYPSSSESESESNKTTTKGETLKFDFYGMRERLNEQKQLFDQQKSATESLSIQTNN